MDVIEKVYDIYIFFLQLIEKVDNLFFFSFFVYIRYTFQNYKLMAQSNKAQIFENSVKLHFFPWIFGSHENPEPSNSKSPPDPPLVGLTTVKYARLLNDLNRRPGPLLRIAWP